MKKALFIILTFAILLFSCACGSIVSSTNATSESTVPTSLRLSHDDSAILFNQEHNNFLGLIDDFSSAISYYQETEFSTADDIHAYEAMWQTMSDDAIAIQNLLTDSRPPVVYEEAWDGFATCMGKLSSIFAKGTDLDSNHNSEYTETEMVDLLLEISDEFFAVADEAQSYAIELERISTQLVASSDNSNDNYNSSHTCIECGKSASESYSNPFSGELEYYCQKHYQEIIDMIGSMESDIGSSNQSKHTCEICTKEGTHIYSSFTGQTEYYCSEHYEELEDMLESFGIG